MHLVVRVGFFRMLLEFVSTVQNFTVFIFIMAPTPPSSQEKRKRLVLTLLKKIEPV